MKNLSIIISVFLLLFIVVSCKSGQGGDKKTELENLKKQRSEIDGKIQKLEKELAASSGDTSSKNILNVEVYELVTAPFAHYVEIQAKVEADENINVSSKLPGTIQSISVRNGDEVVAGQLLAELDNQVIKDGIEEVKTQLSLATILFDKQNNLWKEKIGTEVQFLSAKSNKEAVEKRMESLNEQLEMSRIKSPISGTIDDVTIKVGQVIAPGMTAFRVVNSSKLKVGGEVAEAYTSMVKKGNEVKILFPDLNKELKSKISFVSKAINTLNRSFTVEVGLDANEKDLRPNMIAILKIKDYQSDSALSVPSTLIQFSEEGKYIYLAKSENGKLVARRQSIITGRTNVENTEIRKGLAAGDKIIKAGSQEVTEGQFITQ